MSFVGKLDQFKLPDLLQIISGNRKTGRLSLTRRDSQGVIVFRSGKTSTPRPAPRARPSAACCCAAS